MSTASLSPTFFSKRSTDELIAARNLVSDIIDVRARQTSLFNPPDPRPVIVPAIAPAAPAASECVPSVLSPSAVSCFMDCSARWYYSRVVQLEEKRTAALALGTAVHEAVGVNFQDKIETGRDLDLAAVTSVFRESLSRNLEGVDLWEDETPEELSGCGEALLSLYMERAAPSIHPVAVELKVTGVVGGVKVRGIVDVLDHDGTVVDLKTSARKPSGVSAGHELQVSTYAAITPGASGRGRLDTLTKTKTAAHYCSTFDVTPAAAKLTERLYSITMDQMQTGLVAPRRESFLCSRKHCSFADRCVADFGGEVE